MRALQDRQQALEDLKLLYRVASTAQKLFYVVRELTWIHFDIEHVEATTTELRLHGKVRVVHSCSVSLLSFGLSNTFRSSCLMK